MLHMCYKLQIHLKKRVFNPIRSAICDYITAHGLHWNYVDKIGLFSTELASRAEVKPDIINGLYTPVDQGKSGCSILL